MKRSIFISAFFLLLFTQQLHAQLTWTAIPFGKQIRSFALSSDGSIYVVAPVYVDSTHLFRSTDIGATWVEISGSSAISDVTCDSSGNLIVFNGISPQLSTDAGNTWRAFTDPFAIYGVTYIQASNKGIYVSDAANNLEFTSDGGNSWDSVANSQGGESYDWKGLYCGSGDRVAGALESCNCIISLKNSIVTFDTGAIGNCPIIPDGEWPTSVIFGEDGYVYARIYCGAIRLAPGRGKWEFYDTTTNTLNVFLPLASPNSQSVIFIDSNGTYASTDHGDTWNVTGGGISTDDPFNITVAFDHHGIGYALANDTLYTTANIPLSVAAPQPSLPISLYPIPCSTNLTIHASNIEQIKVFDLLGTLRINQQYGDGITNPELDVSGLTAGVYAVEVTTASKTNIVQMVKE